ncbi:MAG: ribonuclease E/G, partial [Phenylobacterium sp.]|nr:ribonuclease E/G [Phenylobacterium sp.]
PQDAYAWTRPWVPYEDDPFIWFDPSQDSRRPAEAPAAPVEAAPPVAAPEEPSVDIWVELPEVETEKPRRGRRSRGRGRREDAVAADAPVAPADAPPSDAAAEPREAEPEPEAPAKPARARRSRARTAEPAGEAAPEPVTEPAVEPNPAGTQKAAEIVETAASEPSAPEPPVSREPDPAEITTPPPQPRKGWWRRG